MNSFIVMLSLRVTHLCHVRNGAGVVHQLPLVHLDFAQSAKKKKKKKRS